MITAVLLLPVILVLIWLYWYLLPDGRLWRWSDSLWVLALTVLAGAFDYLASNASYERAGPLWPELVSALGVYVIYAAGLAIGLAWRRRSGCRQQ